MSHIFKVLLFFFFFYTFLLPIVPHPLFMLCLDLSACAELANHRDRKETQKTTDNVIESDTNLGLKRDLANQTNALIKRGGRGMASDNEKLLCHVASLACVES